MKKPKVSVIMAAYNMEKYLAEAIESMLSQTFKDFELIIVNDKSTDSTHNIISRYAEKDSRIKAIDNKDNIGFTRSLNVGLKVAKGKYAAILDADDASLPDRLKTEFEYMEKHKKVFLVGGSINYMDGDSKLLNKDVPISGFERIKERLKERNCFWHSTIMFRNTGKITYREKFKYSQDYDLYTRIITMGKIIENLPHVLTNYRIHGTSTSYARRTIQSMFVSKISEFYKQRLETGKDDYDNFDPKSILSYNVEDSKDESVLQQEMKSSWEASDFPRARRFALKYMKHKGLRPKALSYYLLSLLPGRSIRLLRSVKRRIKNKK
jgi:glycosyltransferase involved in cell wall biosynthesis